MDIVEIDQPTPTETIADDGDVILVAGPQKKMLKVHSQCLCAASRVFDTMFSPRWRKGEMSSDNPLEVDLSDDDADAIRLVCLVVHHRNNEIPENLTPKELLQVAIVVEKYLLTTTFRYVRARWLKTQSNFDDILVGNGYMLAAAYLLGDAEAFAAHSHALVLNTNAPYHYLMKEMPLKKFLPLEVIYELAELRTTVRGRIIEILADGKVVTCAGRCGGNRRLVYSGLLGGQNLSWVMKATVQQIIGAMIWASNDERFCPGINEGDRYHQDTFPERLGRLCRQVYLCLDCVRRGSIVDRCTRHTDNEPS